ncbi:SDR family NAD(P)-dependent oxidoreductase [Marinococcus sp. PL1-022]|uniref:SDR family NAD(P)-dependent oxidoreductase n=1 Tax=Marinococcus sp. PL1-022 TaxID=3095363 RepID=UPI0039B5959C
MLAKWGVGNYSATKHATIGITKTIVAEYVIERICENAIAPGATKTVRDGGGSRRTRGVPVGKQSELY